MDGLADLNENREQYRTFESSLGGWRWGGGGSLCAKCSVQCGRFPPLKLHRTQVISAMPCPGPVYIPVPAIHSLGCTQSLRLREFPLSCVPLPLVRRSPI